MVGNLSRSNRERSKRFPLTNLLWHTSTGNDKLVLVLAAVLALGTGAGFPLLPVLFARTISRFSKLYNPNFANVGEKEDDLDIETVTQEVQVTAKVMIGIGAAVALSSLFMAYLQISTARSIASHIRKIYFKALMRQDVSWYHKNTSGTLTARVSSIDTIERAIGQTSIDLIRDVTVTFSGFFIAFFSSWKMTLVIFAFMPVIALSGAIVAFFSNRQARKVNQALGDASSTTSDTFSSIRAVLAYDGKESEGLIYEKALSELYKYQVRRAVVTGAGTGFLMLVLMSTFSVGFIIGNRLVISEQVSLDRAISASAMVPAVFSAFRIANAQKIISAASAAALYVNEVIARVPSIDPLSNEGEIIEDFQGGIQFKSVNFRHESTDKSESTQVLNGLSFDVSPGSLVGLCGQSGSGKSTIVSLVQRLYDVTHGTILLDGKLDIRKANIRWLRSQIGHVGQMPTLFQGTIRENIELGIPDATDFDKHDEGNSGVAFEDIVKAAKIANAHKFIIELPQGYDTLIGEDGAQLSGGQKQRICIARALIRNPKILLLDESTANLDNESEYLVQEALYEASKNRTTLVVAHRLGTIRRSDNILVLNNGKIVESGAHEKLVENTDGAYFQLMKHQEEDSSQHKSEGFFEYNPSKSQDGQLKRKSIQQDSIKDSYRVKPNDYKDIIPTIQASRILHRMYSSGKKFIFFGVMGSIILGMAWPLGAACISELLVLGDVSQRPYQLRLWASLLVCCGLSAFVGVLLQNVFLSMSAERMTKEAKLNYFDSILTHDMSFFDKDENSVGSLVFRLNDQVSNLRGLTVDLAGSLAIAVSSLFVGTFLALFYCWKVALVGFIFMPGIFMSGYSFFRVGPDYNNPQVIDSVRLASEALNGIQTVFSLGKESAFIQKYTERISQAQITNKTEFLISLILFAYISASPFCLFGSTFWQGSIVLKKGQCDLLGMNKATLCLFLGAVLVGDLTYSTPNLRRARIAATDFFKMIKEGSENKLRLLKNSNFKNRIEGGMRMKNVEFSYPSRPEMKVLKGVSTSIKENKTLAFVGGSGSGKSTAISLLERFYTDWDGEISVDGIDVREYNIRNLRSQLGLVDQEPRLFNRTICENIAYGITYDSWMPITQADVERVAKIAYAHDFIMDLPDKYDTIVGQAGSKLSGGQRQRIAIARALMRKPQILLLDEATSALDSETEKIVQTNLKQIQSTVIVVAHRLSTIRDADRIVVMEKGRIVEQGTHEELLEMNAAYARLVRAGQS